MYHVLAGKQRSLKFPIMCNASVKLDYSDNVPDTNDNSVASDDIGYGLWAHTGSFIFEAIITPYDINGYGAGWDNKTSVVSGRTSSSTPPSPRSINTSDKIMPAIDKTVYSASDRQSEAYLASTTAGRLNHEMMVFFNSNFHISLVNTTKHNQNQPAEYAIRVGIKTPAMSSKTEITSDAVILPSYSRSYEYSSTDGIDQTEGFDEFGRFKYWKVNTVGSGTNTGTNVSLGSNATDFIESVNQKVYIRENNKFVLLGEVNTKTASSFTTLTAHGKTLTTGEGLFLKAYQEPTYINKIHQISCIYDDLQKKVFLFLDSKLVKEQSITATDSFAFNKTDCFLGANGTNATGAGSAVTNRQFMGEMHELYIANQIRNKIVLHANLMPNYNDTLLYLRFEEVDL
jgi:hypothetical protein